MFNKCRLVFLGIVIAHGACLVAMDKKQENPVKILLACSAEFRKKEQELKGKTPAIQTPKNVGGFGMYQRYPGSHSPIDSAIPYCSHDGVQYGADFP